MYCLNKRQTNIISFLLNQHEYITAKEIAEFFNVSIRTIRYDLELIEYWLNENKATLVKVPKKGIIVKTTINPAVLIEKLKYLSVENRVLSEGERINYIIIALLSNKKALTIDEISNHLLLSRNTVKKILTKVEEYLINNKLQLKKVYGKGLVVTGPEILKRDVLVEIFIEIFDIHNVILAMKDDEIYKELMTYCHNKFSSFHFEKMKIIFNVLMRRSKDFKYNFTDIALVRLMLYLVVSVNRVSQQYYLEKSTIQVPKNKEHDLASLILRDLSESFTIQYVSEEVDELELRIIESKSFSTYAEGTNSTVSQEVLRVTDHIIRYAENELNVELKGDKNLVGGLSLHLKAALMRIKNNKPVKNHYTDEIKSQYPLVFQIVKESLYTLDNDYTFEDAEIAYITLHIRAAYERNYRETYRLTALVVCSEGLSVLKLLTTKLKLNFSRLRIIETCSIYDFDKYRREIDLIITTDNLKIKDVEVIRISPFIHNEDIYKINQTLIKLNKFKQIYRFNQSKYTEGGNIILLEQLLDIDMIQLKVAAKDWEEAISKASLPLLEKRYVEQAYVDNMIQAVKDLGPYIVIMPGIAFAHARPDESVRQTCMSMITLEKPVNFGSENNDPVSIIFAFGAENGADHLKALQDLAKFLAIEENVEFLKQETNKEIVLNQILN